MARYTYGRRSRVWRTWIYTFVALAVFVAVVVLIFDYNPFKRAKDKAAERSVLRSSTTKDELPGADEAGQMVEEQSLVSAEPALKAVPVLEVTSDVETISGLQAQAALPGTVSDPNIQPNPITAELIDEAMGILEENADRIIEARSVLNEALPMIVDRQRLGFVKSKLSELANEWLFGRAIFPQDKLCGTYKVDPGEQLRYIARRFNVPFEALMEINNISDAKNLKAGQVIKIVHGPFHTVIDRTEFTMDLYLQDTFVRSFPVGLGKEGMGTPTGLWVVEQGGKMIKPKWTDPISGRTYEADDPDYPLGSRWIGLEGIEGDALGRTGFAIHGTKEPETISTGSSQGCIRLHNGDAILVYKLLEPGVSKIRVVD